MLDPWMDGWMGQIFLSKLRFPAEFTPELREGALKDFNANFTNHFL